MTFNPLQYSHWLTESQAAADLGITPEALGESIGEISPWTQELRFLQTRLGFVFDPTTIDAASRAYHEYVAQTVNPTG